MIMFNRLKETKNKTATILKKRPHAGGNQGGIWLRK